MARRALTPAQLALVQALEVVVTSVTGQSKRSAWLPSFCASAAKSQNPYDLETEVKAYPDTNDEACPDADPGRPGSGAGDGSAGDGSYRLRVGLSGGADSLALAAATWWATQHRRGPLAGWAAEAVVVDHGLQAGSAAVAEQAADQITALGLPTRIVSVTITPSGGGIEADARRERYLALQAGVPALILTGHTLDDQAETVLLGLLRGSGTRSLAGMAPITGAARDLSVEPSRSTVVRPLLGLRRTLVRQACLDWQLAPWEDPMNADPAFARSRARRLITQWQEVLGGDVAAALARSAELCRADADLLDAQAAVAAADCRRPLESGTVPGPRLGAGPAPNRRTDLDRRAGAESGPTHRAVPGPRAGAASAPYYLDCQAWRQLPPALASRVLRSWLLASGATALDYDQLHQLARLAQGNGSRYQVGGGEVYRRGQQLYFRIGWPER